MLNKYLANVLVLLFGVGLLFVADGINPAFSIAINSNSLLAQAGMGDDYGYSYPWNAVDSNSDTFYPATVDYGYSQNNVSSDYYGSYPLTNSPENLQTQIPWGNDFAPDSYSYLQSPEPNNQIWTDKAGSDLSANADNAWNQNIFYQDVGSLYGSPSDDSTQRDLQTYGLDYSSRVSPPRSTWGSGFFQQVGSWFSSDEQIVPSDTVTNITNNSDVIAGGPKDDNLLSSLYDRYSGAPYGYVDTSKKPTADFSGETNWVTLSDSSITPNDNGLNLPDLPTASDSLVDKIRGGLERIGSIYKSRTENEQPATFFNSPASSPTSVGRSNLFEVKNGAYTTGIEKVPGGIMFNVRFQTDAFFNQVRR